jgi:AcrR family transcriptional regulator
MLVPQRDGGAPQGDDGDWSTLRAADKRTRVLEIAGDLFAREGLDVPMPRLADAVGVGVGSLYRQVGRKEDIVAALVAGRIERVAGRLRVALEDADPWRALRDVVHAVVDETLADSLAQEGWAMSSDRPELLRLRTQFTELLDALVERARSAGALRDDARTLDLRLVFRSAASAEELAPGGGRRLAELVLRGMAAGPPA